MTDKCSQSALIRFIMRAYTTKRRVKYCVVKVQLIAVPIKIFFLVHHCLPSAQEPLGTHP